ncbi:MAG: hypothetical protein KF683_18625 [Rubrivivax sp.]|nr:hypothetical protein [Rubrivivax sp.]
MNSHHRPASRDEPLVIVGNALAGLVAATQRARQGLPTVLVNPGGPWGGHFAGLQAGGRRWDAGMVLYEFSSFRAADEAPDLASYDPARRNDVGRFLGVVRDWVQGRQRTQVIPAPEMLLDGRRRPDLLLANGWDALPGLPGAAQMREQIAALPREGRWHPRHKAGWPRDGSDGAASPLLYETVARRAHGDALHDTVFAPFIRKVLDRETSGLAALYHRIAWLPLFWPETLAAVLDGQAPALPVTQFSHPVGEPVSALVARLVAELEASGLVALHQEAPTALHVGGGVVTLSFAQGVRVAARQLAWAAPPALALALAGEPVTGEAEDRLPLLIGLLRLPRAALPRRWSVMHLTDPGLGSYRVSDATVNAGDLTGPLADIAVEANPGWFARVHPQAMAAQDEAAVLRAMVADLVAAGLVQPGTEANFGKLLRLRGALPLPTPRSLHHGLQAQARLRALLPDAALLGPAAGVFVSSFADQVVQGLALAARDAAPARYARHAKPERSTSEAVV